MSRIILSGIKHCGKSSVGKELANRLGILFADLDDLILKNTKGFNTIREIYKKSGAEHFMKLEQNSLETFFTANLNESFVLSLGGGTIENPGAISILENQGKTFFLDADNKELFNRIIRGGIPPFLEGANPEKSFNDLCSRRSPLYENWAEHKIDTRGLNPMQIADQIEKIL
ncbi:MAG: hypothetical protein GY754_28180 [bacterium]|nr:hypothetical protein [bacterium]